MIKVNGTLLSSERIGNRVFVKIGVSEKEIDVVGIPNDVVAKARKVNGQHASIEISSLIVNGELKGNNSELEKFWQLIHSKRANNANTKKTNGVV